MNPHKQVTTIFLPIKSDKETRRKDNIRNLSRLLYASCRNNITTELMLAYVIEHSQSGFYRTFKNSRVTCCKRLNISIRAYNQAIKDLLACGLIKKYINANGSTYGSYQLNNNIQRMLKAKGDIHLIIKTNITI